jgi:hypothetical protein
MRVRRFVGMLALVVTVGACGADPATRSATVTPTPTPSAAPSGLRFVKPPRVYVEGGYAEIWVRLNRPLEASASLGVPGAEHDLPGLQGAELRPTCFYEGVYVPSETSPLEDGAPIEVTLTVGESERLVATGTVVARAPGSKPTPERELACPTKERGKPRAHRCEGQVPAPKAIGISVRSAAGTSCREATEVMRSVGRWADAQECEEDLCVAAHRLNRGFRCEVEWAGEADWEIICRRGRVEVRGSISG